VSLPVERLAERRRFGMRPGLDAMRALLGSLGDPHARVPAVHIAGTNGKGAVAAMMDSCLAAAAVRTARYTSPHLVRLNERFFLDGRPMDDEALAPFAERVAARAEEDARFADVTFFEALTAVAFLAFAAAADDPRRPLGMAVLETGLGGRLDATNVCRPSLSVITRVGLDHCAWLGGTLEAIAGEKAGIVKSGVPVVLGRNDPVVRAVVEERARAVGAPFFYAPDLAGEEAIPAGFPLDGAFNRENAATAAAALSVLARTGGPACPDEARARGLSSVVWPGRFQRIGRFLVDGAHNPPAAEALARSLARTGRRYLLIAGFCDDKDAAGVLRRLAPFASRGLAVRTMSARSLPAAETARLMADAGIPSVAAGSLADALALAPEGDVLVCGSLFLAGEALVRLDAYPWGPVRFDPSESLRPAAS
jgi:dihydrofolate synthase/folylpolyglutamate synthase